MPRSVSDVRLDPVATCKYVVFFESHPVAYSNDTTGAITGSGLGSWIGRCETEDGSGTEVLGTREVRPGLIIDGLEITYAIEDIKTGRLSGNEVTIRILDPELAAVFGTDKESEVLAERIPPSTTPLSSSIQVDGGTTDPRGRYIGIERIGPNGERRTCPCFPFEVVGFDHPVNVNAPPVLVSDEPIEFAGRLVSIYRIYEDPSAPGIGGVIGGTPDYTSYYTWGEAHAAGDLVFVGIMKDAGRVGEDEVYSIECYGWDALLRKTLGATNSSNWVRISADLTLADEESYVAIGFAGKGQQVSDQFYDASVFDHQLTGTDRVSCAAELDTWIGTALSGADTNVSFVSPFEDWDQTPSPGSLHPSAGVTSEGVFWIRRDPEDPATPSPSEGEYGEMFVVMHERAWRIFGFEPETQMVVDPPDGDLTKVYFKHLDAGDQLIFQGGGATGMNVPSAGYILGVFRTIAPGGTRDTLDLYDNDGAPREYYPYHTSEVFVLDHHGGQTLRLNEAYAYLEGQLTDGVYNGSEIDGIQTEHARWFALRGDMVVIEDDPETPETELADPKPYRAVAALSWNEGTTHGEVGVGTSFQPALHLDHWCDARAFGFNFEPLKRDWAGKPVGKGGIEVAPLNAYHYLLDDSGVEYADTLVLQILLSTGACDGYDDALDNGGLIEAGPNTHPGAPAFAGDYELADLGLGIPYQLVADPDEWRATFDTVPGGWGGDLNRLRLAYIGPFQALDVLESVLRPRLLCWSLAGKTFGAFRVGPVAVEDADMTITEADVVGAPLDPLTARPAQMLRATGQLDGIEVGYRWNPEEGKTALEFKAKSLDAGARRRTGELVEQFEDHGIMPEFADVAVTGVDFEAARASFRQLWQHDAAEFFARRHYTLEFTLARPLGQDAMPGTSVAISNPWPLAADGTRGIAGATGRIISATHQLDTGNTRVTAIVFVGNSTAHYAPEVFVRGVNGAVIEYYPDHLFADVVDGLGLEQPDWASGDGDAQGGLYQRNGNNWTLVYSGTIAGVNTATRTITMSTPVTGWLRDKDHIFVLLPYIDQDVDSWPLDLYGVVADYDNTIGDGDTPAPAFQ